MDSIPTLTYVINMRQYMISNLISLIYTKPTSIHSSVLSDR